MMSSNLRKIAESNPATLLKKREFWLSQKEFILRIVVGVVIISFLVKLSYREADLLTYMLNIAIYILAFQGIVAIAKALAEIEVESAIVNFVEKKGINYLRDINNGSSFRKNIDSLSQEFIPNNPTKPPLRMIHLFRRICKEAKDRKFESSIYLVQPYREESIDRFNEIRDLQRIGLRLGILGTFMGLILAISQLATFQQYNQSFEQSFSFLFGNLYTCFSTSLVGLQISIFLSFLLMVLREKQKKYFQQMEDTTLTMLSVLRNCVNKDDFLTEFNQVYNLVNELDKKIYDHTKSISSTVKGVENKVQSQTESIQVGIDELVNSRNRLTIFLDKLNQTQTNFLSQNQAEYEKIFKQFSERQKALIDESQKIHDLLSVEDIAKQLRGGLIDAGNYISESINNTEKTIDSQTIAIQKGVNKLAKTELQFGQFLNAINESQTQFINDIRNFHNKGEENIEQQLKLSLDKTLNVVSEQFTNSLIHAGNQISESIKNTEKNIESQTTVIQQGMNKLAETQLEFGQFLDAINESQKQFINEIKNIRYKKEKNVDQQLTLNSDKLLTIVSELKQSIENHSSLIQDALLQARPKENKSLTNTIRNIFR